MLDDADSEDEQLCEDRQSGRIPIIELTDEIKDPRDNLTSSLEYLYLNGIQLR